jgi:hypothetical protein
MHDELGAEWDRRGASYELVGYIGAGLLSGVIGVIDPGHLANIIDILERAGSSLDYSPLKVTLSSP